MKKVNAVLFDVDGVLAQPAELFSVYYARTHNVNLDHLTEFYHSDDFKNASVGKADLKDAILKHQDKWRWDGDIQKLLNTWFEHENVINSELLALVKELAANRVPVYLATQQEAYRSRYIQDVMFPGYFDAVFVTCDVGYTKKDDRYWQYIRDTLDVDDIGAVYFFDDRQSCVDAAARNGFNAHLYTDVRAFKKSLDIN